MGTLAALAAVMLLVTGVGAVAEDITGDQPAAELNDGASSANRHALHDRHEGGADGHIAQDVNYGFEVVGHDTLGGVQEGRYTDVWADDRGFAYVGTFQQPTCDRSGVYVSDIRDPAAPRTIGQIASPPDARVNDVKTHRVGNRTVLIHSLEPCGPILPSGIVQRGQGGISLWDVTDPSRPHALKQNFLDVPVHNTYAWTDEATGRSYLIVTYDIGARDTAIVDITKPQSPKLVAEVGAPDWAGVPGGGDGDQDDGMGSFQGAFNHDVWVSDVGTEADPDYRAVVSYWDAGFVTLDVNDPADPQFLGDSTYPDPDPVTGFSPPEGNGHAAVFSTGGDRILAGDEDFSPYRLAFTIAGVGVRPATEGAFTTPIAELDDKAMNGPSTYLGLGCDPDADLPAPPLGLDPDEDAIAVFQRGICRFDTKATTAINNGYDGFVVVNDAARGDDTITMAGLSRDIPGVFVGHTIGLEILDVGDAASLAVGDIGVEITAEVVFDGWGYFHALDTATLAEQGHYAPCQVNDADFATGFGDLTMHNVEGARHDDDVAFISWYSLGMRAVEVGTGNGQAPDGCGNTTAPTTDYYAEDVTEVGRFIAEDGSNFWGVHETAFEVDGSHEHFVLGSDRNTGLWIFSFDPDGAP